MDYIRNKDIQEKFKELHGVTEKKKGTVTPKRKGQVASREIW